MATPQNPAPPQTLAPRVIAWESTRACNFACVHCRAQAQKTAAPNQLATKEALNLMDQIAELCKPVLIISGGDPLLREDIFEVASYASSRGFRVVMSPSGSNITPEVIGKMKASGIKMISLSLDGSSSEIHDRFRQVPGAFDLAVQNISYAKAGDLPFRINTTVTKHNIDDLSAMQKLAVVAGAKEWDVFMLVPTGRGKVEMEISPSQYEATLQTIYKLSLASPIPIKMTCAPHYNRVIAQHQNTQPVNPSQRQSGGKGCMAGNGFCFISHVGDVFGCGFLPIVAGNVRQQSFKDIYQKAPLFVELRNHSLLTGKCGVCEYNAACGGCRARALSLHKSHLAEEPYCVYTPKRLFLQEKSEN
ncbi:MAG: radical SAM protein [Chloroflexi bacterium]|nr:radical SAM protein [Chloroflexota bacterium]